MITLTTRELLLLKTGLEKLIAYTEKNPLDFCITTKIARITEKVSFSLKDYITAQDTILQKYGSKILINEKQEEVKPSSAEEKEKLLKEGKAKEVWSIETTHENFPKYFEEDLKLQSQPVEILNVWLLKPEELKDVRIPISSMPGLLYILEPEEKESEEKKEVEKK